MLNNHKINEEDNIIDEILAELISVYRDYPAVYKYVDWLTRKILFYQKIELCLYITTVINVLSIWICWYMLCR